MQLLVTSHNLLSPAQTPLSCHFLHKPTISLSKRPESFLLWSLLQVISFLWRSLCTRKNWTKFFFSPVISLTSVYFWSPARDLKMVKDDLSSPASLLLLLAPNQDPMCIQMSPSVYYSFLVFPCLPFFMTLTLLKSTGPVFYRMSLDLGLWVWRKNTTEVRYSHHIISGWTWYQHDLLLVVVT